MIKDNINNCETYYGISEKIKTGFEWIKSNNLKDMADGRYEICEGLYANLQTYDTKENALYEAHRNYIDIQYMISGSEKCGITNYKKCTTAIKYDSERDIEFLNADSEDIVTLNQDEFLIFFPQDAHKPSLDNIKKQKVKKIVLKICCK